MKTARSAYIYRVTVHVIHTAVKIMNVRHIYKQVYIYIECFNAYCDRFLSHFIAVLVWYTHQLVLCTVQVDKYIKITVMYVCIYIVTCTLYIYIYACISDSTVVLSM